MQPTPAIGAVQCNGCRARLRALCSARPAMLILRPIPPQQANAARPLESPPCFEASATGVKIRDMRSQSAARKLASCVVVTHEVEVALDQRERRAVILEVVSAPRPLWTAPPGTL